jgi:glycosyltransferase involved in cell wall biosynthesis
MPHQLVFFPDYRAANPYQSLLYEHSAAELHPRPGTIAEALEIRARQAPEDGMVFHLHWEDGVYRNEPNEAAARAVAERFAADLERFADGGGAVLWTVHNAAPHDDRYPAVQAALRAVLVELADLVHLHSLEAAGWARAELGLPPERLVVVPHGNYRPLHHPIGRPQAASRAALDLPEEARVLLLFGRLDAYKGGAELLEAAARLDRPELRLILAGRQVAPLDAALAALPEPVRARIRVEPGPVPDERVPLLFHAADALVAPYRAVLTSGAAMLALSLGRPVLGPAHIGLADLVRDGVEGLLWPPGEAAGLERTIARFLALDRAELSALQGRAAARAELFDWRTIGNLMGGVFSRLLARRRPMRRPA